VPTGLVGRESLQVLQAGVAGEEGHEYLRVGASPARDRVPSGPGVVPRDGL
jgi:hypothetical protein